MLASGLLFSSWLLPNPRCRVASMRSEEQVAGSPQVAISLQMVQWRSQASRGLPQPASGTQPGAGVPRRLPSASAALQVAAAAILSAPHPHLLEDIGSHRLDLLLAQPIAPRRHRVLAVLHLQAASPACGTAGLAWLAPRGVHHHHHSHAPRDAVPSSTARHHGSLGLVWQPFPVGACRPPPPPAPLRLGLVTW